MYVIIPHTENPALCRIAREIPQGEIAAPRIRRLIADMKKLLAKEKQGVALAAPQVGESLRLFIVSGKALRKHDEKDADAESSDPSPAGMHVYVNPRLVKISRAKKEKHEGCLSIRGKWGEVPRAEKAIVRAFDEHGRAFTRGASGFLAHVFQHEMDHLEGVLYTDRATKIYDEKNEHGE